MRLSAGLQVSAGAAFPRSQSRAEGGGAPKAEAAAAAAESSLTSNYVPLFSFPFWEVLPIQAPLVQTSTWLLTQPSLALSQESCSRPCAGAGLQSPSPARGPGDLIVLEHSSYRLIFRCPLSLVSDLQICWNTVGCSLCSSDQLGISLVLRGSGLCSHLSRRHLSPPSCHGDLEYRIGNGVAKELICLTHGHEQWWGDCLREWGSRVLGRGRQRGKIRTAVIA